VIDLVTAGRNPDSAAWRETLDAELGGRYRADRWTPRPFGVMSFDTRDLESQSDVVLTLEGVDDEGARQRFLAKAALFQPLMHPNILPLLDVGARDGFVYFTTSCFAEESLTQRLQREGRLPISEAVRIAYEVARGLEPAHAEGLLIRELLHEGSVLLEGERVIVAGFITKALGEARYGSYMAPYSRYISREESRGEALDARTDVWEVGALLIMMLTGNARIGAFAQHDLPAPVRRIVLKAIADDRSDRFQSAGELANALGRELPGLTPGRVLGWKPVSAWRRFLRDKLSF
jgi:serine/threonine protein kinase